MNQDLIKVKLAEGMLDSHTHLFHMKSKGMDYLEIIRYCFDSGLEFALDIGINPDNFEERVQIASGIDGLYTSHGYYPSDCALDNIDELLDRLETVLQSDAKAIAVGEMGLDFYHDYGSCEQQSALVMKQIAIADRQGKPVIIHSRNAEDETLRLLGEHTPKYGGIIHCFSYQSETALKFIEMGFYISFAGNVTYKNAADIRDAAKNIPIDRILIETDAPYLSPQEVRGKKNHSGYIGYTYECIAGLREIPVRDLITSVNRNFRNLFRL